MTGEKRRKPSLTSLFVFVMVVISPVLYVLSYAPVYRAIRGSDGGTGLRIWFYRPVEKLVDHSVLQTPLLEWAAICGVGEDMGRDSVIRRWENDWADLGGGDSFGGSTRAVRIHPSEVDRIIDEARLRERSSSEEADADSGLPEPGTEAVELLDPEAEFRQRETEHIGTVGPELHDALEAALLRSRSESTVPADDAE